jgi:hypothetical protein
MNKSKMVCLLAFDLAASTHFAFACSLPLTRQDAAFNCDVSIGWGIQNDGKYLLVIAWLF